MSLTGKAGTMDDVKFIETGKKEISNPAQVNRKMYRRTVENHSTTYTLYALAMKHKVFLLSIGNIVLVLNWVFPAWTQLVLSLIGK